MILNRDQLIDLSKVAMEAAREAAGLIAVYAQKDVKVERKAGGENFASQVVTEVDRVSQELILNKFQATFSDYDLGILTEESEDNQSRFSKDYFWCIDPLDGTLPFTEKREGYSVSIALVSRKGIPEIGVVVNPVNNIVYHAVKGEGVYKNGQKILLTDLKRDGDIFTLVFDRSFLKQDTFEPTINFFKKKITDWGYSKLNLINQGGAVMNACWVLENGPACYFKFPKKAEGGGSLWDFAATACIFNELNAIAGDFNGNPLNINQESLYMNQGGVIYCTDQFVLETLKSLNREINKL